MQEDVVDGYAEVLDTYAKDDRAKRAALSPGERATFPAMLRFACTAEGLEGQFLGFRIITVHVRTKSRSGYDPRNIGLPFLEPLKAVLSQVVEKDDPKDTKDRAELLKMIVKEFVKNDEWEQRAHESYREEGQKSGGRNNWEMIIAAKNKGIDERIVLGGRHAAAYIYAMTVAGKSLFGSASVFGRAEADGSFATSQSTRSLVLVDNRMAPPATSTNRKGRRKTMRMNMRRTARRPLYTRLVTVTRTMITPIAAAVTPTVISLSVTCSARGFGG